MLFISFNVLQFIRSSGLLSLRHSLFISLDYRQLQLGTLYASGRLRFRSHPKIFSFRLQIVQIHHLIQVPIAIPVTVKTSISYHKIAPLLIGKLYTQDDGTIPSKYVQCDSFHDRTPSLSSLFCSFPKLQTPDQVLVIEIEIEIENILLVQRERLRLVVSFI